MHITIYVTIHIATYVHISTFLLYSYISLRNNANTNPESSSSVSSDLTSLNSTASCISNSLNMLEDYSVLPEAVNSSVHYSDVNLSLYDHKFPHPDYLSPALQTTLHYPPVDRKVTTHKVLVFSRDLLEGWLGMSLFCFFFHLFFFLAILFFQPILLNICSKFIYFAQW